MPWIKASELNKNQAVNTSSVRSGGRWISASEKKRLEEKQNIITKSQEEAQKYQAEADKYNSRVGILEGIKSLPKEIGKMAVGTGAIIGDIATRLSPLEGVRNIASGVKTSFQRPEGESAIDAYKRGILESQARPTLYEKAQTKMSGQEFTFPQMDKTAGLPTGLVTQPEYRKALTSAMEAPTYVFGGKPVATAGKGLLARLVSRTVATQPEAIIEAGLATAGEEKPTLKSAGMNYLAATLLMSGISNTVGEIKISRNSKEVTETKKELEEVYNNELPDEAKDDLAEAFSQGVKKEDILENAKKTIGYTAEEVVETPETPVKREPKKLKAGEFAPISKEIQETTGKKLTAKETLKVKDKIEQGYTKEEIIDEIINPRRTEPTPKSIKTTPKRTELTSKPPKVESDIPTPEVDDIAEYVKNKSTKFRVADEGDDLVSQAKKMKAEGKSFEEFVEYISDKLYALNKKAKQGRGSGVFFDEDSGFFNKAAGSAGEKQREKLYSIKNKLIEKFGKRTGKVHEFGGDKFGGIGEEFTITGNDSFHNYYNNYSSFVNKRLDDIVSDKNIIRKLNEIKNKYKIDDIKVSYIDKRITPSFYKDGIEIHDYASKMSNKVKDDTADILKKLFDDDFDLVSDYVFNRTDPKHFGHTFSERKLIRRLEEINSSKSASYKRKYLSEKNTIIEKLDKVKNFLNDNNVKTILKKFNNELDYLEKIPEKMLSVNDEVLDVLKKHSLYVDSSSKFENIGNISSQNIKNIPITDAEISLLEKLADDDTIKTKSQLLDIWNKEQEKFRVKDDLAKVGIKELISGKATKKVTPKIESKKGESITAKKLNEVMPDEYKINEDYDKITLKGELDRASKEIAKNKDEALRKAFSRDERVDRRIAKIEEFSQIAKENNDYAAVNRLFTQANKIGTETAQGLNMLKALYAVNPEYKYMQEIINARLAKVKFGVKDIEKATKEVREIISRKGKDLKEKTKQAFKVKDAQELLNSIMCK